MILALTTYVVKVMILHNLQKILIVHTFTYYLLKSYLSLLNL